MAHKNLHLEREEIVIAHDPDVMMENECQLGHGYPAQVQNSCYSCAPGGHVGAQAKQRMSSHRVQNQPDLHQGLSISTLSRACPVWGCGQDGRGSAPPSMPSVNCQHHVTVH